MLSCSLTTRFRTPRVSRSLDQSSSYSIRRNIQNRRKVCVVCVLCTVRVCVCCSEEKSGCNSRPYTCVYVVSRVAETVSEGKKRECVIVSKDTLTPRPLDCNPTLDSLSLSSSCFCCWLHTHACVSRRPHVKTPVGHTHRHIHSGIPRTRASHEDTKNTRDQEEEQEVGGHPVVLSLAPRLLVSGTRDSTGRRRRRGPGGDSRSSSSLVSVIVSVRVGLSVCVAQTDTHTHIPVIDSPVGERVTVSLVAQSTHSHTTRQRHGMRADGGSQ